MAHEATATCWPEAAETGTAAVNMGIGSRPYRASSSHYSTDPIENDPNSFASDPAPPDAQDSVEVVISVEGSIIEVSGEKVSVQLRGRETILDLPRSLFTESPRYGALVDYAVLRRQDRTRFQRVTPVARELATAHVAEFEQLLADI